MWWTNSLCTSANEDLGTLAEYDPLTLLGYDHVLITCDVRECTYDQGVRMQPVPQTTQDRVGSEKLMKYGERMTLLST